MRIRFKLPIRWPHPTVAFYGVICDMTIENPTEHSDRKKSGTIWSMKLTSQLHQLSCRTSSTACSCETALIHCTYFQRNSFGMCRRHGQKMNSTLAQHWEKLNHPMSQPNWISLLRPYVVWQQLASTLWNDQHWLYERIMSTVIFCTLLIMTLLPSFSWNSMVSWTKSTPSPDNCQSQSSVDPARDTSKQHRETIRKQDLHQALFYPRECFLLSWKDALNSDENLNTSILQPHRTCLLTWFSICATWAVGNLNIVPAERTEPHSKLMLFIEIPNPSQIHSGYIPWIATIGWAV
jgi:hypothetical protein